MQVNRKFLKKDLKNKWKEYFWIASSIYLILGFCNILFAYLGLICFITPLAISIIKGNKAYCNKYCGRGQLFSVLGNKLSLNRIPPKFLSSNWFRYGFLIFFMSMFMLMIYSTCKVFMGADLQQIITILWTFKLPWNFMDMSHISPYICQFAFGFYSIMLTSTIIGLITMVLFRPRTWCVYCPMGTMTQGICKIKNK